MGCQSFVFGYIESAPDHDEHNARVLGGFEFDDVYPFRRVFAGPFPAYRASVISFADSLKATADEWHEWVTRFESLLPALQAISARLHFEDSESSARLCLTYLCSNGQWKRWHMQISEVEGEEVKLHPARE